MSTIVQTPSNRRASSRATRVVALAAALTAIAAAFLLVVRPWYLRWGASDAELRMALPGDEIAPGVRGQETRASAGAGRIAFLAAAAVFQLLTLAQPPLWIGLLLVALLVDVLWIPPAMGRGSARRPLRASSPTTVS